MTHKLVVNEAIALPHYRLVFHRKIIEISIQRDREKETNELNLKAFFFSIFALSAPDISHKLIMDSKALLPNLEFLISSGNSELERAIY